MHCPSLPPCYQELKLAEHMVLSDHKRGRDTGSKSPEDRYYTLESSIANVGFITDESPSSSFNSSSSCSPQGSLALLPDLTSSNTAHEYPSSDSSPDTEDRKTGVMDNYPLVIEREISSGFSFCFLSRAHHIRDVLSCSSQQVFDSIPHWDLRQVLISCAHSVSEMDIDTAAALMQCLDRMVSVSGDPVQRVGAYMLEGLRARLELSGSKIYKSLKCDMPMGPDLMTYMGFLNQVSPYWRFGYLSANAVIMKASEGEPRIHIIDFQIAQGSQWVPLIQALARRPGGPPSISITGVDDSYSAHARGSGLHVVGQRLARVAGLCNAEFRFNDASVPGYEVEGKHLPVWDGEAVMVNFPYALHHIPDESVNTWNHRDRLLRLVKGLAPKVVTLVEQESNTNTKPFFPRFIETLDYYTAMLESIHVTAPRESKQLIGTEQHCVARDIVNVVACEGAERVERHELLGKWTCRLSMAGFTQVPMTLTALDSVRNLLTEFSRNYKVEVRDGALFLLWLNRAMATSSAWR